MFKAAASSSLQRAIQPLDPDIAATELSVAGAPPPVFRFVVFLPSTEQVYDPVSLRRYYAIFFGVCFFFCSSAELKRRLHRVRTLSCSGSLATRLVLFLFVPSPVRFTQRDSVVHPFTLFAYCSPATSISPCEHINVHQLLLSFVPRSPP